MDLGLTFDDVCIVPQYNNVLSRTEPNLSSWLTKEIEIKIPIVPANMDSVIGTETAEILIENGGYPIFHRFTSFENKKKWIESFGSKILISCGVGKLNEVFDLLELGPAGVCIDVAHGHSLSVLNTIKEIKQSFPNMPVIAGNVCTAMAVQDLVNAGAAAVKVGVGPGGSCSTRIVTGVGVPQFTAIQKCSEVGKKLRVPIIADGGIRGSREVALALAAGASSVMIGKLFALTSESPAPKRQKGGHQEAKYRGQASADFQNEFYGSVKKNTVAEGVDFWAPVSGTTQDLIDNLLGGLRSAMTYCGARNIKEFQRKVEFMRVTSEYALESNPRRE